MGKRSLRGVVRLMAVMLVLGLFTLVASCREDRAVRDPATAVLVPKSKSAREFQEKAHSAFVSLVGGAPARTVWVEDPSEESSDTFAESENLHLMGWDTREGGPRRLIAEPGNYGRPLLTPDGRHVVFTEKRMERRDGARHFNPRMRALEWDTGKLNTLGRGFAVDTWAEPAGGRVWVYALEKVSPSRQPSLNGSPLVRFPLNDPDRRETVWTRTKLSADSVQVSRDGRRFSALFPWPDAGIGDVASGRWTKLDVGCWPALAPDDSNVAWVFDGPHRNLRLVAPEGDTRWQVKLSSVPDMRGKEVYHPRWSNHPQFIVFTGPYTKKKKGGRNAVSSGGLTAEVHIGRFSPDLQRLEATVRLTRNKGGDFYPDLWVGGAETATLAGFPQNPAAADPATATWPPALDGLIFAWRDLRGANEVPGAGSRPACHLEARGIGRFGTHLGALLDGGWFEADSDSNEAIAAAIRAGRGLTLQALVTEWPGAAESPPLPLLAWQSTSGESFISLVRTGSHLTLDAGAGATPLAESIPHSPVAGQPAVLAIVWQDNSIRLAIDGKWAGAPIVIPSGLGARWHAGRLVLGAGPASGPAGDATANRARATVERLTVHQRPLVLAELSGRAEIDLAAARSRPAPPRLRVRAGVLEATDPDPSALDSYHRMLVDHTYEVIAVLEGTLYAKKISVLHWAVLDDRPVPGFPRDIGSEVELDLEPHAAHPELQGELTDLGSDEFGLPLFLDMSTPAAPTP